MSKQDEFTDLKKYIQKALIILKESVEIIQSVQNSSKTRIKSIANLMDQLQCCNRVKDVELPIFKDFPDVRDRLLYKLASQVTQDLHQLKLLLQQLTECSERLTKQCDNCLIKFNKHNNMENLTFLTKNTAFCPCLSDIMELIQRCECSMRENALCKKYIIDEFRPELYEDTDSFEREWFLGDTEMLTQIKDSLMMTSFFMEEKIT